ncbi:aldo/keto reductase [Luedemannella flava]|uniref:Aldo/keto reductase n=1 Tax=Luedemannella flava TaxID=349316 RepID=A0ABP4YGM7_9ACTN
MADLTYRRLGASGLVVSAVGLGCNRFGRKLDQAGATAVVAAAIEAGITLFDTADIYGGPPGSSEEQLGIALEALGRRDDVIIATKFGHGNYTHFPGAEHGGLGGRRYIRRAVEASLRRLRTDYLDLYQLHTPDPATPIEETLAALTELVTEGKVRYLGSSNFAGWQIADAAWTARAGHLTPFISAQNEYSLLRRDAEDEVLPAAERFGVGFLPFFPLASGLLSGKYRRGEAPPEGTRMSEDAWASWFADAPWDTIEKLDGYARQRGVTLLSVAIGGLLGRPSVASVIAGATSPGQVRANAAAGAWLPSAEDYAELREVLQPSSRSAQ